MILHKLRENKILVKHAPGDADVLLDNTAIKFAKKETETPVVVVWEDGETREG